MSLVERADMVVVLDQGRILEMGPPTELLATGGFLTRQFQHSRLSMHKALQVNGASQD
jgi:ABC-type multidrug transport system fused ATPase/permease subunit